MKVSDESVEFIANQTADELKKTMTDVEEETLVSGISGAIYARPSKQLWSKIHSPSMSW